MSNKLQTSTHTVALTHKTDPLDAIVQTGHFASVGWGIMDKRTGRRVWALHTGVSSDSFFYFCVTLGYIGTMPSQKVRALLSSLSLFQKLRLARKLRANAVQEFLSSAE